MSDITRRQAVTLGTTGVATAAIGVAGATNAEAGQASQSANLTAAVEKVTLQLVETASRAAAAASTPEDAYKRFMTVAGKGLMQVMADALASAVSGAVTATKDKRDIRGWEKFVNPGPRRRIYLEFRH
jgi:hypothetical protein